MSGHRPDPSEADIHALSGVYAVDALDDLERARFERHLAQCEPCREEVAGLTEAAARLGMAAAAGEIEVSPHLRGRVLDQIKAVRPLPPEVGRSADSAESARSGTRSGARPVTAGPQHRPRRGRLLLAAAAALVVIGGGTAVVQPWDDTPSTPQEVSLANRVITDPSAQEVGVRLRGGAEARAFLSEEQGRVALVTSDMPPAPEGKDYQLWLGGPDGVLRPAGLMSDKSSQTVLFDGDITGVTVAALSVEPAGGSPSPTGPVLAQFSFEDTA